LHYETSRSDTNSAAYRNLFEAFPDPMWIYDASSLRFLEVNPAATEMYGFSRAEFLGMSILDIRPNEQIPELLKMLGDKSRTRTRVITHRKKDGQALTVRVFSAETEYEGRPSRAVSVRDIGDQLASQQALADAEESMEAIVSASPSSIFSVDTNGLIVTWNPAAEALLGVTATEAIGKSASETLGVDRAAFEEMLTRILLGERFSGMVWSFKPVSGRKFELLVGAAPIRGRNHRVRGAMAVLSDITKTVNAQRDLAEWNELLEQRVAARTAELTAANEELDAFCSTISHDLRSPLRAVDGFTKAVLEDYGDHLEEEGRHYLRRVRAASWRMSDLLDDLLGLTRLTRSPLSRETVDLGAMAAEVCERIHASDPHRVAVWEIVPSAIVVGDPRQLRKLLETLFDNAWKFTSRRQVSTIGFRVERQAGIPCFVVEDNGVGFDMTYVDKLFKPFERLHRSTEYPGNGIGLATAQRIVARHGGSIWIEAVEHESTIVRFVLGT
jgi:PAS domain S-box-containing protein